MTQPLDEDIEAFDNALSGHMQQSFGPAWRSMCHQSAKVAARALKLLYPALHVEMKRVELLAMMEGAGGFVHIGWADDPERIEGKIPAHFATTVGTGLYDPTFHQLRNSKTPLDLPPQPYFYAERFLADAPTDRHGIQWVALPRSTGMLRVGYKVHPMLEPLIPMEGMMSDSTAQVHAAAVAARLQRHHSTPPR